MPAVSHSDFPVHDITSRPESGAQISDTILAFRLTPTASSLSLMRHAFYGLGTGVEPSTLDERVDTERPHHVASLPDRTWNLSVDEIWSYDAVGGSVFKVTESRLSPYRTFRSSHGL
jgi:hypothetical protein